MWALSQITIKSISFFIYALPIHIVHHHLDQHMYILWCNIKIVHYQYFKCNDFFMILNCIKLYDLLLYANGILDCVILRSCIALSTGDYGHGSFFLWLALCTLKITFEVACQKKKKCCWRPFFQTIYRSNCFYV